MSKYKIGWIGLRASKFGRSAKILKRDGWMRCGHADVNNRNGFNWIRPVRTQEQFEATDWSELASNGLVGIAFWITDAQWEHNAGLTDAQWQDRKVIE